MNKCEMCINSRKIISENGFHSICCLSQKKALDCMMNRKSSFLTLKKDNELDLYEDVAESDYQTTEIDWSCYEQRTASQILMEE